MLIPLMVAAAVGIVVYRDALTLERRGIRLGNAPAARGRRHLRLYRHHRSDVPRYTLQGVAGDPVVPLVRRVRPSF
jgi:hypothetical protein